MEACLSRFEGPGQSNAKRFRRAGPLFGSYDEPKLSANDPFGHVLRALLGALSYTHGRGVGSDPGGVPVACASGGRT
jgi:hypothetical protein